MVHLTTGIILHDSCEVSYIIQILLLVQVGVAHKMVVFLNHGVLFGKDGSVGNRALLLISSAWSLNSWFTGGQSSVWSNTSSYQVDWSTSYSRFIT